jgi:hypothetical protein
VPQTDSVDCHQRILLPYIRCFSRAQWHEAKRK